MARGFALVSAVLVAGLVAGITTLLVTRQQYLVDAASGMKDSLEAERAVEALEVRALAFLARPGHRASPGTSASLDGDLSVEAAAGTPRAFGHLSMLDGRFNLATLAQQSAMVAEDGTDKEEFAGLGVAAERLRASAEGVIQSSGSGPSGPRARSRPLMPQEVASARFVLLLRALGIDTSVAKAVLDWVDADSEARGGEGAEDDFYSRLDPPYRAANRAFSSVSELLRVRGITPQIYARLAPHVVALGEVSSVHLNSASEEVLMSIGPDIDQQTARALVLSRQAKPWTSVAEFLASPALQTHPVLAHGLAVHSLFYRLDATVELGGSSIRFHSTLKRLGATQVAVIQRERAYGTP